MSSEKISESFTKVQGLRLREIREDLGLTPESAAQRANVSSQQWRKYERGEAEPKVSKMLFLFQEGVSLEWILTGKGSKRVGTQSAQERLFHGSLTEWLTERSKAEPSFYHEFMVDCAAFFPEYAEWLKKRKGGLAEDSVAQRKIA